MTRESASIGAHWPPTNDRWSQTKAAHGDLLSAFRCNPEAAYRAAQWARNQAPRSDGAARHLGSLSMPFPGQKWSKRGSSNAWDRRPSKPANCHCGSLGRHRGPKGLLQVEVQGKADQRSPFLTVRSPQFGLLGHQRPTIGRLNIPTQEPLEHGSSGISMILVAYGSRLRKAVDLG